MNGYYNMFSPNIERKDNVAFSNNQISSNENTSETSCNIRKRYSNSVASTGDKRTATKICRVCGDKAYSYNFNVITCESCKAFFRRNAYKEREIRCPFNGQCDINMVSRRFCQRCRLRKCFEVGMKKEWIMSEEARLEKKQRVQENRERRLAEAKKINKGKEDNFCNTVDATNNFHNLSIIEKTSIQPISTMNTSLCDQSRNSEISTSHLSLDTSQFLKDEQCHSLLAYNSMFEPSVDTSTNVKFSLPDQMQTTLDNNSNRSLHFSQYFTNQSQTYDSIALTPPSSLSSMTVVPRIPSPIHQTLIHLPEEYGSQMNTPMPMSSDDLIVLPKNMVLHFLSQKKCSTMEFKNNSHGHTIRNCYCTCRCGRYLAEKPIAEEIAAEILQNSTSITNLKGFMKRMGEIATNSKDFEHNQEWRLSSFNQDDQKNLESQDEAKFEDEAKYSFKNIQIEDNSLLKKEMENKTESDFLPLCLKDHDRLSEIIFANAFWAEIEPNSMEAMRHTQICPTKTDIINMADGAIRRMIKMVKRISSYKQLNHHDQMQILKGTCMEYIILRGAMSYDPGQNAWTGPTAKSGYLLRMDAMKDTTENMFESTIRRMPGKDQQRNPVTY